MAISEIIGIQGKEHDRILRVHLGRSSTGSRPLPALELGFCGVPVRQLAGDLFMSTASSCGLVSLVVCSYHHVTSRKHQFIPICLFINSREVQKNAI